MDSRSNSEEDKAIKDGETSINVEGSNWSTNGFVKDSFGTSSYGTDNDKGIMSLRIAENMRAVCDYKPFASNSIEQNGMAISFTVRVKNVEDRNAKLIDCLGDNSLVRNWSSPVMAQRQPTQMTLGRNRQPWCITPRTQ